MEKISKSSRDVNSFVAGFYSALSVSISVSLIESFFPKEEAVGKICLFIFAAVCLIMSIGTLKGKGVKWAFTISWLLALALLSFAFGYYMGAQ